MRTPEHPPEGRTAAARRLFGAPATLGFTELSLHAYTDAHGHELFVVVRLKHPDWPSLSSDERTTIADRLGKLKPDESGKIIRPMHMLGSIYVPGRPTPPSEGWPLYGLSALLQAPRTAPVFVVEGEACADALQQLGVVAVTSGGATSANGADWRPLARRQVILWPDNDEAGRTYAKAVCERLEALKTQCTWVDVRALDLPAKGDCVDWLSHHPDAAADDVLALPHASSAAEASSAPDPWSHEAPEPLRRTACDPKPYPGHALGPLLHGAAAAVNQYVQAPLALCAQSTLAVASLVAQRLYNVEIDGRTHPLSLWLLTVADSGERKSAADSVLCREARDWERSCYAAFEAERKANMRASETPEEPLQATVFAGDPTLEGLHKLLLINRGWAGLFSDEAGMFVGGHSMGRDNIGRTVAGLSSLWDNGTADRVRGGDGVAKLYGKRLALHLMMQPVFAEELLSNPKASGQGFLARCLLAWPSSTAGHRRYREGDVYSEPGMQAFTARIRQLLQAREPLHRGERNQLEPPPLRLDKEAKALWIGVHDAIEQAQRPGGDYESIRPWASKAPEQILRVAGVLTVLGQDAPQQIQAAEIHAAAELVDWYLHEAVRLRDVGSVSPETQNAESVLSWCWERGLTAVHSAVLTNSGPRPVRNAKALHAAMKLLEQHGWAARVEGGALLDGAHRRHAWHIRPKTSD